MLTAQSHPDHKTLTILPESPSLLANSHIPARHPTHVVIQFRPSIEHSEEPFEWGHPAGVHRHHPLSDRALQPQRPKVSIPTLEGLY